MGCVNTTTVNQLDLKRINPNSPLMNQSVQKSLDQILQEIKLKHPQVDIVSLKQRYLKVIKTYESFDRSNPQDLIAQWLIKNDKNNKYQAREEHEIISAIMVGVQIAFGNKIPKITQTLSLLLTISASKGVIFQVKTGEGKTMIIAMVALYYALDNKKVDIITSSEVLAFRQGHAQSEAGALYKVFKKKYASNVQSKDNKSTISQIYDSDVIYGTALQFQGALLMKTFRKSKIHMKDRNFDTNHICIVDQVDALLIDKIIDYTKLTTKKPSYVGLRLVFCLIWTLRKQIEKVDNESIFENKITINGFTYFTPKQPSKERTNQEQKIQQKFIQDVVRSLLSQKRYKNMFPQFLQEYISKNLKLWIKNTFSSKYYKNKKDYTRIPVETDPQIDRIVKVDYKNTGVFELKMTLADGVHQFIQLNEHLEPSVESLVTNYEANFVYFNRYQRIIGFTGTIGDEIYQKFLTQNYPVKILVIPTLKERLLLRQQMRFGFIRQEWVKKIVSEAIQYATNKKRCVLIISQTISFCEELKKQILLFKKDQKIIDCFDHLRYWQFQKQQTGKQGNIIVASNLAGRGTDIKITKEVACRGGLYVILTFFPKNTRVEEQAFGRAGRNGQMGSGAFYLNFSKQEEIQACKKIQNNQQQLYKNLNELRLSEQKKYFDNSKKVLQEAKRKRKLLQQFIKQVIDPTTSQINQAQNKINLLKNKIQRQKEYFWALYEKYSLEDKRDQLEQDWGLFLKYTQLQKVQDSSIKFQDFKKMNSKQNPGYIIKTVIKLYCQNPKSLFQLKKQLYRVAQMNESWITYYYLALAAMVNLNNVDIPQATKQLKRTIQLLKQQILIQTAILFEVNLTRSQQHFSLWEKQNGEIQKQILKKFNYKLYVLSNQYEILVFILDYLLTNPKREDFTPFNQLSNSIYNAVKINFLIEEGFKVCFRLKIHHQAKVQIKPKVPIFLLIVKTFSKLIGQPLLCYVLQHKQQKDIFQYLKTLENKYIKDQQIVQQFLKIKCLGNQAKQLNKFSINPIQRGSQVNKLRSNILQFFYQDQKNPQKIKDQLKDVGFLPRNTLLAKFQSLSKLIESQKDKIKQQKIKQMESQLKKRFQYIFKQKYVQGDQRHLKIIQSTIAILMSQDRSNALQQKKEIQQMLISIKSAQTKRFRDRLQEIYYLQIFRFFEQKTVSVTDQMLLCVRKQQQMRQNFVTNYTKPMDKFEFDICIRYLRSTLPIDIVFISQYDQQKYVQKKPSSTDLFIIGDNMLVIKQKQLQEVKVKIFNQPNKTQTNLLDKIKKTATNLQTFKSNQPIKLFKQNILDNILKLTVYKKKIDNTFIKDLDNQDQMTKLKIFQKQIRKIVIKKVFQQYNYQREQNIPEQYFPLQNSKMIDEILRRMWIFFNMCSKDIKNEYLFPLLRNAYQKLIKRQKQKAKRKYPQYWQLITKSYEQQLLQIDQMIMIDLDSN